ncbi:hypothetical protein [Sulfuriferula plumbiphila]|uniref:hypothetical protein n=1 Tax=Sulfuriferula plumbiphila TaxID=171865 RepID=UPI00138707BB|nr:hypothetical protein [Sulfuriferula plumbiphila]
MNIRNFIAVFGLSLAGLAGSLACDTAASSLQVATTNVTHAVGNHKSAVVAVSYRTPAYAGYASSVTDAAAVDKSSVSAVPEVDIWTMLVAILGLTGMRLWRGGKKGLPAIN